MDAIRDPDAWSRLEGRALWGLEHPDQSSPLDLVLQIRLWSYPRWGPHLSWGLFLPVWAAGRALVRESRWNAPADRQRMSSALLGLKRRSHEDPSLRVRDAFIDAGKLEPFLLRAPEALSLGSERPAVPAAEHGSCGVEGFRSLTHARFEWSDGDEEDGPEAVAWAVGLRRLLRESLKERE